YTEDQAEFGIVGHRQVSCDGHFNRSRPWREYPSIEVSTLTSPDAFLGPPNFDGFPDGVTGKSLSVEHLSGLVRSFFSAWAVPVAAVARPVDRRDLVRALLRGAKCPRVVIAYPTAVAV